jgi:hypothetical protein
MLMGGVARPESAGRAASEFFNLCLCPNLQRNWKSPPRPLFGVNVETHPSVIKMEEDDVIFHIVLGLADPLRGTSSFFQASILDWVGLGACLSGKAPARLRHRPGPRGAFRVRRRLPSGGCRGGRPGGCPPARPAPGRARRQGTAPGCHLQNGSACSR